jgi:hypothetical protein
VHPLDSARAKIGRANEHLDVFRCESEAWMSSNPYSVRVEPQIAAGHNRYRLQLREKSPDALPLIAGDCFHNARSALDHVAWQLAGADPMDTTTQFPIFADEAKFISARRQYERIPTRPLALVKYLQPYRREKPLDDALWILYAFDNADKHKVISLCAGVADESTPAPTVRGPPHHRTVWDLKVFGGPYEDDAVLAEVTAFAYPWAGGPPSTEVYVDLKLVFSIALRDSVSGVMMHPATQGLRWAIRRAETVVEMFNRYL